MLDDIERARDALYAIPADLPRDDWVKAGMAAHAAGLILTPSTTGAPGLATMTLPPPATHGAVSSPARV